MKNPVKVLYLDSETTWRGGQNQLRLLATSLVGEGEIQAYFALDASANFVEKLHPHGSVVTIRYLSGFNMVAAFKLARLCRHQSIQIIHAQSSKAHWLGLWVKRFNPKLKLVVHRRVDNVPKASPFQRWKYRTHLVDSYVAISKMIQSVLVEYGIPADRITLARSAIDPVPFRKEIPKDQAERTRRRESLLKELGLNPNIDRKFWIVIVGAMTEQKGHAHLLRALAKVRADFAQFHCFVLGEGKLRGELTQLANNLGLNSEVTFIGFRSHVHHCLPLFDLFALPSNWEGLGTAVLEAMAAGLPVLASRVGGIPEMVEHLKTGYLTTPGDADSIAAGILVCASDPGLREKLASQAEVETLARFSVEEMAGLNLRNYHRLTHRSEVL